MPRRAYALAGGLVAFAIIVLGIAAWAKFSGAAGSQRGLVIRTEIAEDLIVALEDGQSARLGPSGDSERAFVVKRADFPGTITVSDPDGNVLFSQRFEYSYFADAEFRLSFDRNGFYPTTELRDTPIPTP